MNRPSSIPSSEARLYVARVLGVMASLSLAVMAVVYIGYRIGFSDVGSLRIFEYQSGKLESAPEFEIAFVGDSALGYGINAELFSELSGRPTINLALNGIYGFGGTYNMIRHALKSHSPRVVVIMQTLDIMTRHSYVSGYYYTSDGLDREDVSPTDVLKIYLNFEAVRMFFKRWLKFGWHLEEPTPIVNDYTLMVFESTELPPDVVLRKKPLRPDMINVGKTRFLKRIAELCRSEGLQCLYAHGTIYEGYCDEAAPYIERVDGLLRETGLTLVESTPLCVPFAQVGDTVDHVQPELKDEYTRRYYAELSPYLSLPVAVHSAELPPAR